MRVKSGVYLTGSLKDGVIRSDLYFQSLCCGLYPLYNNSCPPDSIHSPYNSNSNDFQTNTHTSDLTG